MFGYLQFGPFSLDDFLQFFALSLKKELLGHKTLLQLHLVLEIFFVEVLILTQVTNPGIFVGVGVSSLFADVAHADDVVAEHAE